MIRTVVSLIAWAGFLIATAAAAGPIFPPLVSGQYAFGVRTAVVTLDAEGVPTRAPSRSVGIRLDGTGELVHCESPAGPDGEVTSVLVTVAAAGDRAAMRCVAFSELDCAGKESEASDDAAFVFFTPPAKPSLELTP